jgi:hypothetical protein
MIRHIAIAAAAVSAMHASCCVADETPLLAPSREVAVLYRLTGASVVANSQKLQVTYASEGRVRLDYFRYPEAKYPYASLLYDPPADLVTTVLAERYGYIERDVGKLPSPASFLSAGMKFERIGSEAIDGLRCTDWRVASGTNYEGAACVTDDGVVLRATREKPAKGSVEALAVHYGELPPGIFLPPTGFRLIHNPQFSHERMLVPETITQTEQLPHTATQGPAPAPNQAVAIAPKASSSPPAVRQAPALPPASLPSGWVLDNGIDPKP